MLQKDLKSIQDENPIPHSLDQSNLKANDGYPLGEDFINEGRGFSPTHLKFFLLVFSQIKRSQREDQA